MRKSRCPSCGSKNVATILYGKPVMESIQEPLRRGEIVLAGRAAAPGLPTHHCNHCDHEFGRPGGDEGVHA